MIKNNAIREIFKIIKQDLYSTYLFLGYLSHRKWVRRLVIFIMIDSIVVYPSIVDNPYWTVRIIQHVCLFFYCLFLRFLI